MQEQIEAQLQTWVEAHWDETNPRPGLLAVRASLGQMTSFIAHGTDNRLTRVPHPHRILSNIQRGRNGNLKGHKQDTGTISQGRVDLTTPIAWKTETTSALGTSKGRSRTDTGRKTALAAVTGTATSPYENEDPPKQLIPIAGGLQGGTYSTVLEELQGPDFIWVQRTE